MAKKKKKAAARPASQQCPAQGELVPMLPNRLEVAHGTSEEHQTRVDIVDIVLARGEEKMTRAMEEALRRHKEANAEAAKLNEAVEKLLKAAATECARDVLEVIRGSEVAEVLQLPRGMICEASAESPVFNDKTKRWGKTLVTLQFYSSARQRGDHVLTRVVTLPADREITDRLKQARETREAATAAYNEAMQWKKRLAQMNRLERVTRAQLAEERVRDSEEGAAILDTLLGSLDGHIKALPGM